MGMDNHSNIKTTGNFSKIKCRQDQTEGQVGQPVCCGKAQWERKQKRVTPRACGAASENVSGVRTHRESKGQGARYSLLRTHANWSQLLSNGLHPVRDGGTHPPILLGYPKNYIKETRSVSQKQKIRSTATARGYLSGCHFTNNWNGIWQNKTKRNLKFPLLPADRCERPVHRFTESLTKLILPKPDLSIKTEKNHWTFCGWRTNVLLWNCITTKRRENIRVFLVSIFTKIREYTEKQKLEMR